MKLLSGFPLKEDYLKLLRSNLYKRMESYSNKFIKDNKDILHSYSRRWVTDPFHQWSRQWEYPYVYERIENSQIGSLICPSQNRSDEKVPKKVFEIEVGKKDPTELIRDLKSQFGSGMDELQNGSMRKSWGAYGKMFEKTFKTVLKDKIKKFKTVVVLDTGSGLTFIPFFIKTSHPNLNVQTIDKDPYTEQFRALSHRTDLDIPFTQQNIRFIQIESEKIDLIYCISVIEHIPQRFFKQTIFELYRILKPYGKLILTMDIDYKNGGMQRLHELENIVPGKFLFENIPNYILDSDIVNTHWIYDKFGTKLFPGSWKRRTKSQIPKLTVYCVTLIKLGDRED